MEWTKLVEWLLTQGWVGVLIILMGTTILYLTRQLEKKDTELNAAYKDRIADMKEVSDKTAENIGAFQSSLMVLTEIVKGIR